jgi:hypothetical protein
VFLRSCICSVVLVRAGSVSGRMHTKHQRNSNRKLSCVQSSVHMLLMLLFAPCDAAGASRGSTWQCRLALKEWQARCRACCRVWTVELSKPNAGSN